MRIALLVTVAVCVVAVVSLRGLQWEGRLLRADPDAIPGNASLMDFAGGRGAAQFTARCSTCHGSRGEGDPFRGIPALNDAEWLYGTGLVSDIELVIKYGIRSYHPRSWNLAVMPAYATARPSARDAKIAPLTAAQIRDLVEFLLRQQGQAADRAAAERGAALFAGRGGCYDCHAADGKGDPAIGAPNLTDRVTLYGDGSRTALAQSIAYGRHGMCPSWDRRMRPAEVRETALFVHSLSHRPGK